MTLTRSDNEILDEILKELELDVVLQLVHPEDHTDLMLDIETFGTGPDSVVISIGAVRFRPADGAYDLGKTYFSRLDVQEQLNLGRTIEGSTLDWWFNPEQRTAWDFHRERPTIAFDDAFRGLKAMTSGADRVWANSPSFDCVIVRDLCRAYGLDAPWHFRAERDCRTLFDLAWSDKPQVTTPGVAHTPVADCLHQIKMVTLAFEQFAHQTHIRSDLTAIAS